MRLQGFISEDIVTQALSIEEPKTTKKYSEKQVTAWMDILQQAAEQLDSEIDSMEEGELKKAKQAKMSDVQDKIAKWEERLQAAQEPEEEPTDEVPPEGEEPPPEDQ